MAPQPQRIRAKYADKFRCIGAACEDTCCAGWEVAIDSQTLAKYQGLSDSPLKILLEERIVANPKSVSDLDFAQVKLDPSGRCPFLAEQGLCNIQIEHGARALSSTCANYPRVSRQIDAEVEISLQLSCPEAARLVLLDRNFARHLDRRLLRLRETGSEARKHYLRFATAAEDLPASNGNPMQYFWEVRHLALMLLQDRSYPLWQRLFVLGLFCNRLSTASHKAGAVPELLRSYAEIMSQEKLRGEMERIAARPGAQLSLVTAMLRSRFGLPHHAPRFRECLQDFLEGLGCGESISAGELTARYADAAARHLARFMEKYPHVLENFLLSSVVRKGFPYGDGAPPSPSIADPSVEFASLALRFTLLKGILIGMAARYKDEFSPSHAVKLIQSFTKEVDHNAFARAGFNDCVRAHDLARSEAIAMMLRD